MKIVFFVNSLRNPFVDAWFDFLALLNCNFVILAKVDQSELDIPPVRVRESIIRISHTSDWRTQVEERLGGIPDLIIYWWGLQSILRDQPRTTWPESIVSVVVDTFPNASRKSTSYIETMKVFPALRMIDIFIVTSTEMRLSLIRKFGRSLKNAQFVTLKTPFTQKSHSPKTVENFRFNTHSCNLIYFGRSDYLFSKNRQMRKDDVSEILTNLQNSGANIFLRESGDDIADQKLIGMGFRIYKNHDRESLTNGLFSEFLDGFSGQLPIYNLSNSTIVNRVSNSLSTRFAQGICSSTPVLIQSQASFAREFVENYKTGLFLSQNYSDLLSELRAQNLSLRKNWVQNHNLWASESFVNLFQDAIQTAALRKTS